MTHMLTLTHIMGMGFCGYGYGSAFSDPGLTHGDPYSCGVIIVIIILFWGIKVSNEGEVPW